MIESARASICASASLTVTACMLGSLLNAAVQLAQEWPAVPVVIFPGVFAVQDDRNQRVAAARENAVAVLPDAEQEIVGGCAGVHAGIDEADEVA